MGGNFKVIKVLIADDEALFRKAFIASFEWEEAGMCICGEACNGKEALELVRHQCPDIVLVDIEMPLLNGLDFIVEIKKISNKSQIVIISGYDKFSYAQKAIQLGVRDYFLKPVNDEKIWNKLLALKEEILINQKVQKDEREKRQLDKLKKESFEEKAVYSLIHGTTDTIWSNSVFMNLREYSDFGIQVCCISIYTDSVYWQPKEFELAQFAIKNTIYEQLEKKYEVYFTVYEKYLVALVKGKKTILANNQLLKEFEMISFFTSRYLYIEIVVGLGNIVEKNDEIKLSFENSKIAVQKQFLNAKRRIIPYQKYETKLKFDVLPLKEQLHFMDNLRLANYSAVEEWISSIFDTMVKEEMTWNNIYQISINLLLFITQVALEYKIDIYDYYDLICYEDFLNKRQPVQAMKSAITELAAFCIRKIEQVRTDGRIICKIKEYVAKFYSDYELRIKDIADAVFLNENYLSSYFKKKVGISLTEYIMCFRVEKGKDLMDLGEEEIREVALKVGFLDANYFSKCFKKVYGVTPTKYLSEKL